jgi:hypothetical protein
MTKPAASTLVTILLTEYRPRNGRSNRERAECAEILAYRVKAVLAKAQENKQAVSTRGHHYWAGWNDAMDWVIRALDGEDVNL